MRHFRKEKNRLLNTINNCNFNAQVEIISTSSNIINNSIFNARVNIKDNSINLLKNCDFNNQLWLYGAQPELNFTLPISNISNIFILTGTGNATISGYVNMPSTGSIISGKLIRYYPIQINDTYGRCRFNCNIRQQNQFKGYAF